MVLKYMPKEKMVIDVWPHVHKLKQSFPWQTELIDPDKSSLYMYMLL